MLEPIEKLLILQDRDRKITRARAELANIEPERARLLTQDAGAKAQFEKARQKLMELETDRKRLDLEIEGKKQQIEKYSLQQFQTRKNEEYRALAHEIDTCKADIRKIEDHQLDLMEQAEQAQKAMAVAVASHEAVKKMVSVQTVELASKEEALVKQLDQLEAGYEDLESAVEESLLTKYQRLRKHKGDNSVVGIEHSVCGGCHMKLPTQVVITCQGAREVVTCPNCGRILYHTRDMDLTVPD